MILHACNDDVSPGTPRTLHRPLPPVKHRRWHPGAGARAFAFGVLTALVLLGAPPLSRRADAQDQATIDKLVQLNKRAMDDYDTAEFDAAKKALLDAEKLGKRSGLESHPVMARTFIHLGALYLVGYKDKQKAQHYFGKALDIQPDIKLDKNLTSPTVRDLFASVQGQKGSSGGGDAVEESLFPPSKGAKGKGNAAEAAPPPAESDVAAASEAAKPKKSRGGEPDLPTEITALDCPYPDETPPGKKVTLRCVAAASLKVYKVALYYKGFEMKDYERMDMTKSAKGWEQATIPKKRVEGKSLQFYFEGLDESDRPVVSNGRAESPNVMLIVAGGSNVAVGSDEEENPLEADGRGPRLQLGSADDSKVGLDDRFGNRRFWIGIGIGTGLVYAVNGKPESRTCGLPPCVSQPISVTGAGWAGLAHLVPEIGWQLNPDWAISVAGRHQYILQDSTQKRYTASGAHAVLLKVRRFTKQNQLRFFYGVAGGGGEGVRMNIISDEGGTANGMTYKPLKDTILVGGILLGGMGGVYYEVSKGISLAFEVDALYAFPKSGLTVDGNALLQINFGDTSGKAEKERAKRKDSVAGSIDDEDPQ